MATPALTRRAEQAGQHVRLFGVALVATLLVTALDLPWRLSGLAFGALTIYAGIRLLGDLSRLRSTGQSAPGRLGVIVGIGLTGLMMLVLLGETALYPLVAEQDRCLAGAITHQDQRLCRQEFERHQQELLRRLGRPTATRS